MRHTNIEIILDHGETVFVDFTLTDIDKFQQGVTITGITRGDGTVVRLTDVQQILPSIYERIDEYLRSIKI